MRALLLNIRRRNAHILPRALGPELARFRRMRSAFYVLGEEDEAAIAVQCLETFLPRWAEREEVVALARALPPPAPGEKPDRIQGTDTTFMGMPFVKQYRAPGT